jgi:ABC-type amino acid transport substrate-binding protein
MTNKEKLIEAKIISANVQWTPAQEAAIDNLTQGEIDALITVKNKVATAFPPEGGNAPVMHHD